MQAHFNSHPAAPADVADVSTLTGELLTEIMAAIGEQAFQFDVAATTTRLNQWLTEGCYMVLLARDAAQAAAGFIALHESRALYAGSVYGAIPECYVRPAYRLQGLGRLLIAAACAHGHERGWQRL